MLQSCRCDSDRGKEGGSPRITSQSWSRAERTASTPDPCAGDRGLVVALSPMLLPLPQGSHSQGEPGRSSAGTPASAPVSPWQVAERENSLDFRASGAADGPTADVGGHDAALLLHHHFYTLKLPRCKVLGKSIIRKSASGTVWGGTFGGLHNYPGHAWGVWQKRTCTLHTSRPRRFFPWGHCADHRFCFIFQDSVNVDANLLW